MKTVISITLLLFVTAFASAQGSDTTVYEEFDTTIFAAPVEHGEYDDAYASSTYTQHPGELNPTKRELGQSYTEKKFNKSEWKKIVGETNYTEDPTEEAAEEKKENPEPYGSSSPWNPATLKIIGYALILILIAVVIYFLFKSALQDHQPVKNSIHSESLLYGNQNLDTIAESDIDQLLREAIERGDLRAAVRLYYIKLLKHLHTTGFIAWKKDKTNHEYAHELAVFPFTRDFRKLMIAYEIIWYGERTPSSEEFKKLQRDFTNLHRQATRNE